MPNARTGAIAMRLRRRARRSGVAGLGLALAALAAAGIAPGPAVAQLASGASGSSTLEYVDHEEALRMLRAFGSCYASRHPEESLALMATDPASLAEAETYRRMFRRGNQVCLGGNTELAMPVALVRGAIVEGLYTRGVALPPNLALTAPAPESVRTLSEAARCYTSGHREQVRVLVEQTSPGSRREFAALSEIAPDFFRCVPETARGRRFDPVQIRYRLSEALYRMPASTSVSAGQE